MRTVLLLAALGFAFSAVAAEAAGDVPRPRLRPPRPVQPEATSGWPPQEVSAARARCQSLLAPIAVVSTALAPLGSGSGCGAPAPISVTAIAGVRVDPPATLTCEMAAALHGWITTTVQPAAKRRLNTRVTEIHAAASYVCRLRNNASSGKLSEHGRANALDMSGFSFALSEAVAVKDDSWGTSLLATLGLSKRGSFLEDIREGACGYFTTVLGPGSDAYHGNHFHVDALVRKGGYRICK